MNEREMKRKIERDQQKIKFQITVEEEQNV